MKKIIAFDCDSTLSAIEGVDELGRLASAEVFAQVEDLTNQAMNGEIAIEEIFGRRLDLIQPSLDQMAQIGELYLKHIEPTAKESITQLQKAGWEVIIISGGFRECILPLAQELGITRVEAVPLFFAEDGNYLGFDKEYPTTRSGGKPELIRMIKSSEQPDQIVMVGDGVSDLETLPEVDQFIAFTKYISRSSVVDGARYRADSISAVNKLIL